MEDNPEVYKRKMGAKNLEDLTPIKARDLLVESFFEAQKEASLCAGGAAKANIGDETMRRMVVDGVMTVCQEVGVDYNHPTKEGLERVEDSLEYHARLWGTPKEIVDNHKKTMSKILNNTEE